MYTQICAIKAFQHLLNFVWKYQSLENALSSFYLIEIPFPFLLQSVRPFRI